MFLLDRLFLVTLAISRLIESTQRLNVEKAKPKAHCGGDIGVVRSNKRPFFSFPVTMDHSKIPSEMGVAPPHKRFTQFSALIKL